MEVERPVQPSGQLRVRFTTEWARFKVTETPFSVPLRLTRSGLSDVINHLLARGEHRAFDFLVGGRFLRTSLHEYITQAGVSGEAILTIVYEPVAPTAQLAASDEHPDWVSGIDASLGNGLIVTACYDGAARVLRSGKGGATLETLSIATGVHDEPLKAVAAVRLPGDAEAAVLVTASQDRSLVVWRWDAASGTTSLVPAARCHGHGDSVQTVAARLGERGAVRFASGACDGTVKVWHYNAAAANANADSSEGGGKRRKVGASGSAAAAVAARDLAADVTLTGHTDRVETLCWAGDSCIVSGSWDRSLRTWDVERCCVVRTTNCDKVVCAVAAAAQGNLLASAHADAVVRIWDERVGQSARVSGNSAGAGSAGMLHASVLRSHDEWVSSLAWAPDSERLLLSGAHDGTVKVWDIRSSVPLQTVTVGEPRDDDEDGGGGRGEHYDNNGAPRTKALAVAWLHGSSSASKASGSVPSFCSGGDDSKLTLHAQPAAGWEE